MIDDFLAIAVVGVGLSLVVEWLQSRYGTGKNATKIIAISLSVLIGTAYWFLQGTAVWQATLGILASASTVYSFVFSGRKNNREDV